MQRGITLPWTRKAREIQHNAHLNDVQPMHCQPSRLIHQRLGAPEVVLDCTGFSTELDGCNVDGSGRHGNLPALALEARRVQRRGDPSCYERHRIDGKPRAVTGEALMRTEFLDFSTAAGNNSSACPYLQLMQSRQNENPPTARWRPL